tara:strand:- start:455 stop:733 length:279 start_codon:yes stop_codon:yes gene_type:complete
MKIEYSDMWFEKNADRFDDWFNPDTFNWYRSSELAFFCSKHFDKWWDAEKFRCEYDFGGVELISHCMAYIDIWYNSSKFEKSYDELLIESIK